MNKLLTSILFSSVVVQISAAPAVAPIPVQPRLVVNITIDQLRTDYLHLLLDNLSEKGFKRLLKEGVVYENIDYELEKVDCSIATTTLSTGTYPQFHGICGNTTYYSQRKRSELSFFDAKTIGNFTNEMLSPTNILTSTITDELKIASDGLSRIYSIAPFSSMAIAAGGHTPDGVYWIDDTQGFWASSTYYGEMPKWLELYNRQESLPMRIDTMVWEPLLPITAYQMPFLTRDFIFKHIFGKFKEHRYDYIKTTPFANSEVNRLAKQLINKAELGKRNIPDMLCLGYSAGNYRDMPIQEYSLEIQDIYLRLDRDIAQLLDMLDKEVGLNNTLIVISSTGYFNGEGQESEKYKVPGGDFYPDRATTLLNMYLMAIYGQQQWVEGYHNNTIYLNRKLIENKQIGLQEIQLKCAEFLTQMSGVRNVIMAHQLLYGNGNNQTDRLRRGIHPIVSGDLFIEIQSGWRIVYENQNNRKECSRYNAISAPAIFFGMALKPVVIETPVKATAIVPTIARKLCIRPPNAAKELPLQEVIYNQTNTSLKIEKKNN